jgi:hypothetical protein
MRYLSIFDSALSANVPRSSVRLLLAPLAGPPSCIFLPSVTSPQGESRVSVSYECPGTVLIS